MTMRRLGSALCLLVSLTLSGVTRAQLVSHWRGEGNGNDSVGSTLEGVLDEIRFYNRALSASEMQAIIPEPTGAATAALVAVLPLVRRSR